MLNAVFELYKLPAFKNKKIFQLLLINRSKEVRAMAQANYDHLLFIIPRIELAINHDQKRLENLLFEERDVFTKTDYEAKHIFSILADWNVSDQDAERIWGATGNLSEDMDTVKIGLQKLEADSKWLEIEGHLASFVIGINECFYLIQMMRMEVMVTLGDSNQQHMEETYRKVKQIETDIIKRYDEIGLIPTKVEIGRYTKNFSDQAREFKNASFYWLIATVLIAVLVIAIAGLFLVKPDFLPPVKANALMIVQSSISRALIFVTLFFGLSLAVRNFKANKHNQIINQNKSNALASFQAFVSTPMSDEKTKDVVIQEVAKAIYDIGRSGFSGKESDINNPVSTVVGQLFKQQ